MRKRITWILGGGLALLVVAALAFVVWAESTHPVLPEAADALSDPADGVDVEQGRWIVFTPEGEKPTSGLIFYPGGRVDPAAYAPLLRDIAAQGYRAVVVPMPLNLAVLHISAADAVMAAYPEVQHWAVGGHSLGGAMAAQYTYNHPGAVEGLLLLASYPASSTDLSQRDLAVTSVYGSQDGLATVADIAEGEDRLPFDTTYVPIAGGNHAGFGSYGAQRGDNPATLDRAEQRARTVAAAVDLLASLGD